MDFTKFFFIRRRNDLILTKVLTENLLVKADWEYFI